MTAGDSYFSKALTYSNRKLLSEFGAGVSGVSFDTIVGTGLSGTVYVSRVAPILGKRFAIVRKADDQSTHSLHRVEGSVGLEYTIADDFMCSGRTVRHVIEQMHQSYPWAKFMGVWCYESRTFRDREYALNTWKWADAAIHGGPKLGPLTLDEMREHTWDSVVRISPKGGWPSRPFAA
jgi:adenine/guanine phosphoribosyltransferase-like PRPP-binding protein